MASELQKSLPAEADGAVHMTAAVKAAAAPPTVAAINALVFMLGFLSLEDDGSLPPLALAELYGFPGRKSQASCVRSRGAMLSLDAVRMVGG